jgi:hypothetical protein
VDGILKVGLEGSEFEIRKAQCIGDEFTYLEKILQIMVGGHN